MNKQSSIFVIPAPGKIVRNPDGSYQPLPPEGASVMPNAYWLGQIRDGAVKEGKAPGRTAPGAVRTKVTTPTKPAA